MRRRKWGSRAVIALALIVLFYVVPSVLRLALLGWYRYGFICGIALFDILGCMVIGFLTNNYKLGALLYLGTTGIELLLLFVGHSPRVALWICDVIPAVVAIYYSRQIYVNMGD
jgi:hypothetical protein